MDFSFEERASDSPFVQRIWQTQSEHAVSFFSPAVIHWEIVVMKQGDKTTLTVRGPETKVTLADSPANSEFFGIQLKVGTFMPHLPISQLVDNTLVLPQATNKSFWLHGSVWELPNFENADTFVDWLTRDGLLVRDPVVEGALAGHLKDVSLRSVQRRFLQTTGLTHKTVQQIERAAHSAALLKQGMSILDTAYEAGYFDQSHLTNALKRFVGQTPAQLVRFNQLR